MTRAERLRLLRCRARAARPSTGSGRAESPRPRHGVALVGMVAVSAIVLAVAAMGLLVARADLVLSGNLRDGAVTYFHTRSAAVRAVAVLPAGYGFDAWLREDGGVAEAIAEPSCTARAVRVVPAAADIRGAPLDGGDALVRLTTACLGPRGARRSLEVAVARALQPFVPGALYLERPDVEATAPIVLDGRDHAAGDPPGQPSGPLFGVLPAAGSGLDAAVVLPVVTDGRSLPIVVEPAARIDAAAFAARLLAAAAPLVDDLSPQALAAPVVHVPASARVDAPAAGTGLLVIDGALRVDAPLEFTGVMVVGEGIEIAATGSLTVRGWLWVRGAGVGPAVRAAGPLAVRFGSDAVAEADRHVRLPRRAVILGEREP